MRGRIWRRKEVGGGGRRWRVEEGGVKGMRRKREKEEEKGERGGKGRERRKREREEVDRESSTIRVRRNGKVEQQNPNENIQSGFLARIARRSGRG